MGDGYFYTLSAIAQSFAAIIALNGVFVLYKLQLLRSRRDELYARLQELWVEDMIDGSSYSGDHAYAQRELKRISKGTVLNWAKKHGGRGDIVEEKTKIVNEYEGIDEFSRMVIQYFRTPVIFNGITIMLSLFLLPWRDTVPYIVQYALVTALLIWCCVSLLITMHSVFRTLELKGIGIVSRFFKHMQGS